MTLQSRSRPIEILLVEDNPGDVRLTREVFADARVTNHLSVVNDGEQAMAFLRHEGDYAGSPRPDLILLDLNLPRKSGREVLEDVKTDPKLLSIPIVVMTTSEAETDILNSYHHHANAYVTKPVDLDCFIDVVNKIEGFWLTAVKLPTE
jgi:two-component system response regulator